MSTAAAAATEPTTESEREALARRRSAAGIDPAAPRVGLAFSGGGIRSATFCLGVLRALARNKVLHRFDYLSTVSGGGYIGSAFGRLFHAGKDGDAASVEKGVADDGSLFLWWLRNNGRFLAPAGASDLIQALASQLRGFLATQVEVAVLIMLFAGAITLPHLAYSWVFAVREGMPVAMSLWWWLLPLPAAGALTMCYAYWFLGKASASGLATAVLATIVGLYLAAQASATPTSFDATLLWLGAIGMLPSPVAWVCARVSSLRRSEETNRVRYTKGLARCLKALAVVFAFGLLDMLSWYMKLWLTQIGGEAAGGNVAAGVGVTTVLIGIARFVLPMLQTGSKSGIAKLPWGMLANVLGLILVMALALFWMTIFQTIIFPDKGDVLGNLLRNAYARWASVFVISLAYVLLNGRALQQLNRSSLHFFYRSRIARAYVSVGNGPDGGAAHPRFPASPLVANSRSLTERTAKITSLMDGDDVAMTDYVPHHFGGPIHLVNCCINQTVDDRTGTYNADRKGVSLTVSALGVETGTQLPEDGSAALLRDSTVAEWIAISGAAIGSGMGSLTRPGTAAMAFLSGLRLGYWQDNLTVGSVRRHGPVAKYFAVLREMFARFPGLGSAEWYLSDGGHFDNTGVYALLKRQLALIVLVDGGADPDYCFADVENLVRKARIDYDATIAFVDPAGLIPLAGALAPMFGTPETISNGPGDAHLLLARITYADGQRGTLLIVKPRTTDDMPLDIAGYANREESFPQQSTSNQFFNEAQWESYCELGVLLGAPVDPSLIGHLPVWAWNAPVIGANAALLSPAAAPMSRTQRLATTVGTSIGVGALLTALLAGWQAWDSHKQQMVQMQSAANEQTKEVNDEVRSLLTYLSAPERQSASFDPSVDATVNLLTSDIGNATLSDQQVKTMQDLANLLSPICARTQDATLVTQCDYDLFVLTNSGHRPTSAWNDAMANYNGWRDPAAVAFVSATTTAASMSLGLPEAGPSPPPPPVRAPATRPAAAPIDRTQLRNDAIASCAENGQTFMLYTQIYDESQRDDVLRSLAPVRELGIVVPGVENVTDTAKRNGKHSPFEWKAPTLLYAPEGKTCATALVKWGNATLPALATTPAKAVALPVGTGTSNVLELWIPRRRAATP
ncbi:MAG TPA: patatin-like phospholipase family protein [Luteibacter sp.]|uniref:patatin-like phospholipase family protein n=1 Tax=Luteibacter sp. TaxID=1886636 RepID=UPI002C665B6C|nr:patatin-like phospholipase family protein [Luteibacter sp.]HVI54917.1 patatin-like phospholipase family protein [Luteibacter sp.]